VQRAIEKDDTSKYGSIAHSSTALERAPASVRERLVFPYLAGVIFMGTLYRSGGYPLVNGTYLSPPRTTEQVLHPEKYVMGEAAVDVRPPRLPPGFVPLTSGSMGELQTKTMLRACNSAADTARAAAGWGGDSFVIGSRGGAGALLWATTWDSPEDAVEFERAVNATATCWARELGPQLGATRLLRSDKQVAVSRGLGPEEAALALGESLRLASPASPARPPFGPLVLRSVPPEPVRIRPTLAGQSVIAPYLGLSLAVPPGFVAELSEEILLRSSNARSTFLMLVSDRVVSIESNERLYSEFLDTYSTALGLKRDQVAVVSEARAATPLGPAFQRTWMVNRTSAFARLTIVPACRGTGALVLAQTWTDPATLAQIDWIIANLRQLAAREPPLCAELNP
jgi:hypothetical protein